MKGPNWEPAPAHHGGWLSGSVGVEGGGSKKDAKDFNSVYPPKQKENPPEGKSYSVTTGINAAKGVLKEGQD